jgi:protein involved in polysaccharide export with SLBB domain
MKRPHIESDRTGSTVQLVGILIALLVVMSAPCAAQEPRVGGELVSAGELPRGLLERYTIQVGDVLDVTFFKTESMNQQVTVGPDGEIYLPLVGRVRVVGRTVDDVTKEITEGYRKEMIDPLITVSVAEFSGLEVYVSGEVQTPGIQPYRGGLTLLQAISAAGGFNRRARRQEVLLIRPGPDNQPVGTIVDVKDIQRRGQLSKDIPLAPLDIIYVHHKKIVNVNIFVEQYISDNIPRLEGWALLLWGEDNRNN